MASKWAQAPLGELCEFRAGSVFSPALQGRATGEVPFIKVSDMNLPTNSIHMHASNNWISSEVMREIRATPFAPGTVVFAKIGEALRQNRLRQIVRPTLIDNNLMGASPRKGKVDPQFLYYALSQFDFSDIAQGTALPYLTISALSSLALRLPPQTEQRAIAHILGAMDDKIELNRRMNETLEAMAQALFKSWFVDFDPVRANAQGYDAKLSRNVASQFPTRLVPSTIGLIPEGWNAESLGNHIEATRGLSYKGNGLAGSGVPLHNLNSIYEGGGYKHDGIKYYLGEYAERNVLHSGDLIVANTEQGHHRLLIGYAAIVPACFGEKTIFSHHLYRLKLKLRSPLKPSFLYSLLNSRQMHDVVSRYANGTTVNMLPVEGIQRPLFACPPAKLIDVFDGLVSNALQREEQMLTESRILAAIRDALLPKLLSGEIRVKDAEKVASAAA